AYEDMQEQLQEPFYNIDHVEYIKGSASAIFGQSEPGGVINLVTKKPLPFKRYEFDVTTGSYNEYRFMTDFTGAVSKSKKFLYRFVAGYENSKALDRNQHIENIFIAPQIEYMPSLKTSVRLSIQYSYDDRIVFDGTGVPAFFDTTAQKFIPGYYSPRTSLNSVLGRAYSNKLFSEISFTHNFSDKIKFTSLLLLLNAKNTVTLTELTLDASYLLTSDSIPVSNAIQSVNHFSGQSSSFANFKFNTGFLSHNLVAGIDLHFWKEDLMHADIEQRNVYVPNPDLTWGIYNFNEAYKNLNDYNNSFGYKANDYGAGVYSNDLISFGDKWKLFAGIRFDYFRDVPNPFYPANTSLFKDTSKTTTVYPKTGLIWQPSKNISFYILYNRGFYPQHFSDKGYGGPFPPEKSAEFELGTKLQLMQGNLLITASAFSIQQYNIVVGDTIPNQLRLLKHLYSKGIDFSVQGKLTKYLNVMGNYSFNITKIGNSDSFFIQKNQQFPGVPRNAANAWLNYEIFKTGISVGAGFNYTSVRTTFTNGFLLPAYTTVDAGLSYTIHKFRLACNLYNITNERYWTSGSSSVSIYPGNPFSFRFNINYLIQ
ncbi:MAG TPA: TonB-dependent receptor, partial [Parafilimonas sp.]